MSHHYDPETKGAIQRLEVIWFSTTEKNSFARFLLSLPPTNIISNRLFRTGYNYHGNTLYWVANLIMQENWEKMLRKPLRKTIRTQITEAVK